MQHLVSMAARVDAVEGVPHDAAGQLRVVRAAVRLLDEAQTGGTIVEL